MNTCIHVCVKEKKEKTKKNNKKKLSNHRCSYIHSSVLDLARVASVQSVRVVEVRSVVCEQWYEYTTRTHKRAVRNTRERRREEKNGGRRQKKEEQDALTIIGKKRKEDKRTDKGVF
jgi:hypothetical protein